MLKNKHVIAALIITPLLAIGGYFMLDAFVGEKPHAAQAGKSYPLVALPNCRYTSGKCTLKNNDFKIELGAGAPGAGVVTLQLQSAYPLQVAKMALVDDAQQDGEPEAMQPADAAGQQWQIALKGSASEQSVLRVVVVANGAFYFGETGLAFLTFDTPYHADFRRD